MNNWHSTHTHKEQTAIYAQKQLTTLKHNLRKTCACSEEELVCASSPGRWHTGPLQHSPAAISLACLGLNLKEALVIYIYINLF